MIGHLLNREMAVYERQSTGDGGGGQASDWTDTGRTVRIRLSQPSAAERQTAAQAGVELSYVGYATVDADIDRSHRLIDDDLVLDVTSVVVPSDPRFQRIELREEPWRD